MKIGVTGHQHIEGLSWDWTTKELRSFLSAFKPDDIFGYSCLAIGADQIFAEEVIKFGGNLVAVLPFQGIERTFPTSDIEKFHSLLNKASEVLTLEYEASDEVSFYNAGKKVVQLVDFLVAIWDQKPSEGLGGTGDIVEYANQLKKPIVLLNPYKDLKLTFNY